MSRSLLSAAAIVIALSLSACSSIDVGTDWDREVDFNAYRTFAWIPAGPEAEGQLPPHLDLRLRRVVDEIMDEEKGIRPVQNPDLADLLLVYYIGIEKELRIDSAPSSFYGAYGYGYWPSHAYGTSYVREFSNGTLVLDIIDRESKQLVWTSVAEGSVQSKNPPSERVEKVVRRLLEDYPPR